MPLPHHGSGIASQVCDGDFMYGAVLRDATLNAAKAGAVGLVYIMAPMLYIWQVGAR
jgi:hypothetical protein